MGRCCKTVHERSCHKCEPLLFSYFIYLVYFLEIKNKNDYAVRKGVLTRCTSVCFVLFYFQKVFDCPLIALYFQAGIHNDNLSLALEPEAASLFCKYLPVERITGGDGISCFKPGSRYLVLDAGGEQQSHWVTLVKTCY